MSNAQAAIQYTAGMDAAGFAQDRKTRDAVERCLERISEAAAKLGDEAAMLMPEQPWQAIRALGNRLRHEYDSIRPDRLWAIIENDLPSLCDACRAALQRLRTEEDF